MLHIVMGLPGTGKTSVTKYLEEKLPAISINTDVLHSKLFPSGERTETGDFTPEQLKQIYATLRPLAYYLAKIAPDRHFIMEGTFRKAEQREGVIEEMENMKHPYKILLVETNDDEASKRIQGRFDRGEDPSTVEDYFKIKEVFEKPSNAYMIDNSTTLEELYKKIDEYIENIKAN